MFTAKEYAMPQNLDEAYKILTAKNTNLYSRRLCMA